MSNDTAFIALDEPQKFRTVRDVELALDDLLPETSFTPPQLARIAAVAREKHADRRSQLVAILDAAAQEVAGQHAPASPALRALDAFRAEFEPQINVEAGGVRVELERHRPQWANPDWDQPCGPVPDASRWRSEPVELPLTMHTGFESKSGAVERACLRAHLTARPIEQEPFVRLGYRGWRDDQTPSGGRLSYDLRLDEAAAFARALLLLVDVAREEVGGE
ncbi:hypothetical protein HWD35_23790 [Tsukamurella tyrosinosolvens]|uniref:hypothetical protein n=1 Tax=Tsukamurella tyrosinosolvens TaxID=57704 RepID=UPI001CE2234F|nr:hypothetical protein [Tsukamurella tyrosinosolvens]MCA4997746.1 hypothetical protein [Tsukamurella tyrosinosolvens]